MAESTDNADPFGWSTERLIQELYKLKRSRDARPNKWPDLDRLAEILREHELEGYDLITFEDLGGPYAFDSLCKDLGIVKIPHKNTLRYIIKLLKELSPAYLDWKTAESQRHRRKPPAGSQDHHDAEDVAPSSLVSDDAGCVLERESAASAARTAPPSDHRQAVAKIGASIQNSNTIPLNTVADGLDDLGDSLPVPKKRKRVAPVNISTLPDSWATKSSSYTQNGLETGGMHSPEELWQESAPGAYLGDWKLPQETLLQPQDPLREEGYVLGVPNFGWAIAKPIPAGRRLQVDRILRRYLKPKQSSINLGRRQDSARSTDYTVEEDDDVLPLLGESDEEEAYDSETLEEMRQEERERANLQPRKTALLSGEAVDFIIDDAIRNLELSWAKKKLPKLQRDMHKTWTDARRYGLLKSNVARELSLVENLGRRITSMTKAIRLDEWRSEAQIRSQVGNLEASIEDRQRARWRAKLFASPAQPPINSLKQNKAPCTRRRGIHVSAIDDGDEILTSASEEEDDIENYLSDGDSTDAELEVSPLANPMLVDDDVPAQAGIVDNAEDVGDAGDSGHSKDDNTSEPAAPSPQSTASTVSTGLEGGERPPLDDLEPVLQKGTGFWEKCGDVQRLLCTLIFEYNVATLQRLFDHMGKDDNMIWNTLCVPTMHRAGRLEKDVGETSKSLTDDVAGAFTRLFDTFITRHSIVARDFFPLSDETRSRLEANRGRVGEFCVQLRILQPYFASRLHVKSPSPARVAENRTQAGDLEAISIESSDDSDDVHISGIVYAVEELDDDDKDVRPSPSYRRRRQIRTDKAAQNLREKDKARAEALKRRREANLNQLVLSGAIDRDKTRLIINDAREDGQSVIYISPEIGLRIRDHQIAGVRFMWNQLLMPAETRQGCLLAHTMGLGKTMQVITLLVAIAEAAISPDKSIVAQVPADLRESKTLILCPSGLVENWLDELSCWTPSGLLGSVYPLTSELGSGERLETVQRWSSDGGILVLGYPMLRKLLEIFGDEMKSLLEDSPHIVIADEAHALKNPKSKLHEATANFRTTARIAMTGSPLANSVEEYHSMINWVAPNYLADHREFAAKYATPIKEGFYRDSTVQQKRRALMRLKVLKDTVAPKIHRATVATLKGELPQKKEFILYLPLTELQMQVYCRFIDIVHDPRILSDISNTVQLWNLLFNLTLLLAHPKVFMLRLEEMKSGILEGQRDAQQPSSSSHSYAATLPLPVVQQLLGIVRKRDIDDLQHSAKVMVLMGILDEARDAGDKVLIFSQSKLVLDYLEDVFQRKKRRFRRLDGDTAVQRRQGMVKSFNAGQDEIYLISTTAGGVGLNIHGANRVVIFDFRWNPMHEQQAIGRAYRIGQTKPVFVYWLITGGTFETVLHDQAVFKTQLASRVVDKKNPQAWTDQMRNYTARPTIWLLDPTMDRFEDQDVVLAALLKSNKLSRHICKIVSTDTFEEEEPEDKLSAEEIREADTMILMNKMRHQNPQISLHLSGYPAERMTVDGTPFAPAAGGSTTSFAPVNSSSTLFLPTRDTPDARSRPENVALQPPKLPLFGNSTVESALLNTAQQASNNSHPTAAGLQPMRIPTSSTGTVETDDGDGSAAAGSSASCEHGGQSAANKERQSFMASPEDFEEVLRGKLTNMIIESNGQVSAPSAQGMAHKLVSDIRANIGESGLPALSQWSRLRNLTDTDAVFAKAVIAGYVSPKTLATMTGPEEERLLAKLHAHSHVHPDSSRHDEESSGAATTAARERNKDPDHIKAHVRRSMNRDGRRESGGGRGARDLVALRELLDRRKSRRPAAAIKTAREPSAGLQQPGAAPGPETPAGNNIYNPLVLD